MYCFVPPAAVYSQAPIVFCHPWHVNSDKCHSRTSDLQNSVCRQLPDSRGLFKELEIHCFTGNQSWFSIITRSRKIYIFFMIDQKIIECQFYPLSWIAFLVSEVSQGNSSSYISGHLQI